MKIKLLLLLAVCSGACAWLVLAQTNSTPSEKEVIRKLYNLPRTNPPAKTVSSAETNAPQSAGALTNAAGPAASPTTPAGAAPATTNVVASQISAAPTAKSPASLSSASTNVPAPVTAAAPAATATEAPTNAPAIQSTGTNAPAETGLEEGQSTNDVMPLVVMRDVALTEAIKTLARQAGLNVMFSPQVELGIPGANGKPIMPMVSIRLENVTAQQVLEALLNNYGLEMVKTPPSPIAEIRIKNPNAPEPLETKIFQLKYSAPTNMASILQPTLSSRSHVIADTRTSRLIVIATEKEMTQVKALIAKLDTATKQVLIQADLVETTRNPKSVKGIDWTGTLEGQTISVGNGVTSYHSTTTTPGGSVPTTLPSGRTLTSTEASSSTSTRTSTFDPINNLLGMSLDSSHGFTPGMAFLNAQGAQVVLSFLNNDSESEVIATPHAVTLDNQMAKLEVIRALPIFKITPGTSQTPAGSQVDYTNVGTILQVTPHVTANSNILMRVIPEVSSVEPVKDRQVINGTVNEANIFDSRRIEANVMIPDGHTLVMAGLISDNISKSYVKVPVLGDIPILGYFFRKDTKERNKSNLLIFITPSIVRQDDFQAVKTDFLKTKPIPDPAFRESAWDSGKPFQWKGSDK